MESKPLVTIYSGIERLRDFLGLPKEVVEDLERNWTIEIEDYADMLLDEGEVRRSYLEDLVGDLRAYGSEFVESKARARQDDAIAPLPIDELNFDEYDELELEWERKHLTLGNAEAPSALVLARTLGPSSAAAPSPKDIWPCPELLPPLPFNLAIENAPAHAVPASGLLPLLPGQRRLNELWPSVQPNCKDEGRKTVTAGTGVRKGRRVRIPPPGPDLSVFPLASLPDALLQGVVERLLASARTEQAGWDLDDASGPRNALRGSPTLPPFTPFSTYAGSRTSVQAPPEHEARPEDESARKLLKATVQALGPSQGLRVLAAAAASSLLPAASTSLALAISRPQEALAKLLDAVPGSAGALVQPRAPASLHSLTPHLRWMEGKDGWRRKLTEAVEKVPGRSSLVSSLALSYLRDQEYYHYEERSAGRLEFTGPCLPSAWDLRALRVQTNQMGPNGTRIVVNTPLTASPKALLGAVHEAIATKRALLTSTAEGLVGKGPGKATEMHAATPGAEGQALVTEETGTGTAVASGAPVTDAGLERGDQCRQAPPEAEEEVMVVDSEDEVRVQEEGGPGKGEPTAVEVAQVWPGPGATGTGTEASFRGWARHGRPCGGTSMSTAELAARYVAAYRPREAFRVANGPSSDLQVFCCTLTGTKLEQVQNFLFDAALSAQRFVGTLDALQSLCINNLRELTLLDLRSSFTFHGHGPPPTTLELVQLTALTTVLPGQGAPALDISRLRLLKRLRLVATGALHWAFPQELAEVRERGGWSLGAGIVLPSERQAAEEARRKAVEVLAGEKLKEAQARSDAMLAATGGGGGGGAEGWRSKEGGGGGITGGNDRSGQGGAGKSGAAAGQGGGGAPPFAGIGLGPQGFAAGPAGPPRKKAKMGGGQSNTVTVEGSSVSGGNGATAGAHGHKSIASFFKPAARPSLTLPTEAQRAKAWAEANAAPWEDFLPDKSALLKAQPGPGTFLHPTLLGLSQLSRLEWFEFEFLGHAGSVLSSSLSHQAVLAQAAFLSQLSRLRSIQHIRIALGPGCDMAKSARHLPVYPWLSASTFAVLTRRCPSLTSLHLDPAPPAQVLYVLPTTLTALTLDRCPSAAYSKIGLMTGLVGKEARLGNLRELTLSAGPSSMLGRVVHVARGEESEPVMIGTGPGAGEMGSDPASVALTKGKSSRARVASFSTLELSSLVSLRKLTLDLRGEGSRGWLRDVKAVAYPQRLRELWVVSGPGKGGHRGGSSLSAVLGAHGHPDTAFPASLRTVVVRMEEPGPDRALIPPNAAGSTVGRTSMTAAVKKRGAGGGEGRPAESFGEKSPPSVKVESPPCISCQCEECARAFCALEGLQGAAGLRTLRLSVGIREAFPDLQQLGSSVGRLTQLETLDMATLGSFFVEGGKQQVDEMTGTYAVRWTRKALREAGEETVRFLRSMLGGGVELLV